VWRGNDGGTRRSQRASGAVLVEHEVHHKAQVAVYLREMGKTPPYFAAALENGARPDIEMREKFGGF
jgi:uncharacterized damage-inducible protein DinB